MKILLPIKGEYIERILRGEKKYEYRHTLASENVEKIILYATAPQSMIVGEVDVIGRVVKTPTALWEETKKHAGISRKKFREYFHGRKEAKAYVLGTAVTYSEKIPLDELGIEHAPQSFAYLTECPICSKIITKNIRADNFTTAKSEEHIIPLSLGNDQLVLPPGTICDECNNYFARKIEKDFLSNEVISILRSYHVVPNRKRKIPSLEVQFGAQKTKLEIDPKNNCCYIGLSEETINSLRRGKIECFSSPSINIEKIKDDYATSRFLIKVFLEVALYYSIKYHKGEAKFFVLDEKMKELSQYVRVGSKERRIYDYSVAKRNPVVPFSSDDFVASIKLNFGERNTLVGMTLNLYELEFTLTI